MATATTMTTAKAWHPDLIAVPAVDAIPSALILNISTKVGVIEGDEPAVRVPLMTMGEAAVVQEGQEIPESSATLAEMTFKSVKIGALLKLSREQYVQDGAAVNLAAGLGRAIVDKGDKQLLNAPAPLPDATGWTAPTGLLATPGLTDGGKISGSLDALVAAVAGVITAGGTPSHIVMAPDAWVAVRQLKVATGSNQPLVGADMPLTLRADGSTAVTLLGLPVVVSNAMPSKTILIVDKSDLFSVYSDVMVDVSDQAYFTSDVMAVRGIWRYGAGFGHPNRHVKMLTA